MAFNRTNVRVINAAPTSGITATAVSVASKPPANGRRPACPTAVKTEVVPPMPSARISTISAVLAGRDKSRLTAKRTSSIMGHR
jgi:hypothetical protein